MINQVQEVNLKVELFDNIADLNTGMGAGFETGAVIYEGPMLSEVRTHAYNPHTMLELGVKKFGEVFAPLNTWSVDTNPILDVPFDEAFK